MTAFPISGAGRRKGDIWPAALLAVAGLLLTAPPVFGADDDPVSLTAPPPGDDAQPGPAEAADTPDETENNPPSETAEPSGEATDTAEAGVSAQQLGAIDPDSVGLLSEEEGGFGVDMWRGTARSLVLRLVPRVPDSLQAPVLQELAARLLASAAKAPDGEASGGEGPGGAHGAGGDGLLAKRLERLVALGEYDLAERLAALVSGPAAEGEVAETRFDLALVTGDLGRGCELADVMIRRAQTPFWQRAFIFCQLQRGEHAPAQLGLTALIESEKGGAPDPLFVALADSILQGQPVPVAGMGSAAPLHLAMMDFAGIGVPADMVRAGHAATYRFAALNEVTNLETRLYAAELAVLTNALAPGRLREIYASVLFTREEVADVLSDMPRGPKGRALLYRAALEQKIPSARAQVIHRALERAHDDGVYAAQVRVYRDLIDSIPPSAGLAWFGAEAARALLFLGNRTRAFDWFEVLSDEAGRDSAAREGLVRTWPIVQLADGLGTYAWQDEGLSDWWRATDGTMAAAGRDHQAETLFALLTALGEPVDRGFWSPLIDGSAAPPRVRVDDGLEAGLSAAADALATGEVVLLSLVGLGKPPVAEADPNFLARVVAAYRFVGLEEEARRLAVEAVLLRGL